MRTARNLLSSSQKGVLKENNHVSVRFEPKRHQHWPLQFPCYGGITRMWQGVFSTSLHLSDSGECFLDRTVTHPVFHL